MNLKSVKKRGGVQEVWCMRLKSKPLSHEMRVTLTTLSLICHGFSFFIVKKESVVIIFSCQRQQ